MLRCLLTILHRFLLPRLYMNALQAQGNLRQFRKVLQKIPGNLGGTIDDAIQRVENQSPALRTPTDQSFRSGTSRSCWSMEAGIDRARHNSNLYHVSFVHNGYSARLLEKHCTSGSEQKSRSNRLARKAISFSLLCIQVLGHTFSFCRP